MNARKYFAFALFLGISGITHATHEPTTSDIISYDGSAIPSPVVGAIGWSTPNDGYDWYCADVTSGEQVTVNLSRTSGDLLLNTGIAQGIAAIGQSVDDLSVIDFTENDTTPGTSFAFTPDFSGPITIWVSTWAYQNGGDYSMATSGATARSCSSGTSTAAPVPTLPEWALYSLVALVMVLGISMVGSRRTNT